MESDRQPAESVRSESDLDDARKRLGLVTWHLREIEDALEADHPEAADLAADLVEETGALAEVVDAIGGTDDRWGSLEELVQR